MRNRGKRGRPGRYVVPPLAALALLCGLLTSACKPKEHHRTAATTASGLAARRSGTGAAPNITAFAWEAADLPACYAGRAGAAYFVWRLNETLHCNGASGQWE